MTKRLITVTQRVGWLALVLFFVGPQPLRSSEPARKFLEGLRERGYYDMAVEYLEQLKTSPLAPSDIRETLLYELGTTLIQSSRDQRDMKLREDQLEEASQALTRFTGMMPDHPLVPSANSQLGNLIVERARIKVEQSKQPGKPKDQLLAEGKEIYDQAYQTFEKAKTDLRERLEKYKNVPPDDTKTLELRDMLRTDYLQAQLLSAAVKEEMADTTKVGSEEYKKLISEASAQYGEVNEKYRTRLAGLYARMYQGRCEQKLGKHKDALSYFSELLDQPDNPEEFRTLKTKTLLLAMESWEASKLTAEAVDKLGAWIDKARPNEAKDTEWLTLRLGLAKAQWKFAQDLKEKNPKDPQVRRSESEARKNAKLVARESGDLQKEARKFQVEIGVDDLASTVDEEPQDFDEAKQAGRDALDALQTANMLVKALPARIAKETDATNKADLQKQLAQANETVKTALEDAKRYFRTALEMADEQTDARDLNIVRYFLCYLYYSTGDYMDAALVGEFIARRYPDSSGARQSAKIAMASYLKLYTESPDEDKSFESDHVVAIAEYIATKWDDQPEAVEALNTLIPFKIQAGDLDAAERYLEDIPETSPKRGDAEIKTGQAMWGAYLRGMAKLRQYESTPEEMPAGFDIAAEKQRLEELKTRAQRILVAGITRMQAAGKATDASVTAALSLAQVYVDTEQIDKAIELLEDPALGPLALVKKSDPAATREGFPAEVYKTSLRAYISSLPTTSDANAVIAKATEVMDAMKETIDQKALIGIYLSLAKDLESQMNLASPDTKKALSKGFETFLLRLQSTSKDLAVLNWVAETFVGIAKSFDTERQTTPEAAGYYAKASDAYQGILDKATIDDDKLKMQIQLRMANVKQRLNKFTEARDIYKELLTKNQMMVNVQIDAAKLYQEWAGFPGKEALYMRAIQGAEIDPTTKKPVIWGWQGISTRTASIPDFRNVFHEARYNLGVSLYELATAKKGDDKTKYLGMANRAIKQTQQLFNTGPEWDTWRPKYDALMKKIQKAQGQKPVGLEEEDEEDETVAKTN